MKRKHATDLAIHELVEAASGRGMSMRERHLLKESLRNLVRLAKSELLVEMKSNVSRLTGISAQSTRRARAAAARCNSPALQQRFEFNQMD